MTVTVRFAPSPTGHLHLGSARIAVVNALFAQGRGGRLILRIDDTDAVRSRPELEAAIEADLRWLDLAWGLKVRQSERSHLYAAAMARLEAAGAVYPAYETQDELRTTRAASAARGLPPRYDRAALRLRPEERRALEAAGRRPHWRFRLPDAAMEFTDLVQGRRRFEAAALSDPVLCRADGGFTYVMASVVDDLELGISHIIRGEDHLTNTAAQLALIDALGGPRPETAHLPLLADATGAKLSKRLESLTLESVQGDGIEPGAVVRWLAALGTSTAPAPDGPPPGIDLGRYGHAMARLDMTALRQFSAAWLHHRTWAEVARQLPGLDEPFWLAVRGNCDRLADASTWWRICNEPLTPVIEDRAYLASAADLLAVSGDAAAWLERLKATSGRRGRALLHPLRLALTAREQGPELRLLPELIGLPRCLRRLRGETA